MFDADDISDGDTAMWKLVLINVSLGTIAFSSCFNGVVSFSFIVICAAITIRIYKLDPEPFLLLSLHTSVSSMMLHDAHSTVAAIVAVLVMCSTVVSMDVSLERIAVFLASLVITSLQGKAIGLVAVVVLALAIIIIKLRPLRPAVNAILILMVLATSVPFCGHVTAVMATIVAVLFNIWCICCRLTRKAEASYRKHAVTNNNDHHHHHHTPSYSPLHLTNGGLLKPCNTGESLDLHGHSVTTALKALHQFLREHEESFRQSRTDHTRYLRVITGEDGASHSEDPLNLIKPTVANFLKVNKYKYQVVPDRDGILQIDLGSHVQ